jgi:5-methylcytosine-specific restriction endonuclease McrA
VDKIILEQQVALGKSTYSIAEFLNLSQSTIRYWLKLYGLKTAKSLFNYTHYLEHNCPNCNNITVGSIFCTSKCKSMYYSKSDLTIDSRKRATAKRALKRKNMRVNLLIESGGKCSHCGYNKNHSALIFHHINPVTKLYNIDSRSCINMSKESLDAEVAKCIVLCHNCHSELHNPQCAL